MCRKSLISLVALLLAAVPVQAVEHNFPAGSWIIPMDNPYQPEADQGLFEAYGLVWELLANGVTVHWIIDSTKTTSSAVDLTIFDIATNPVVEELGHGGGTTPIPGVTNFINYTGGPWVIDAADVAKAMVVLQDAAWNQVNIHEAKVAFSANVQRTLSGTPPKIALMNDTESTTSGNAVKILASYLVLANICGDAYEVVTPNQIRDGILQRPNDPFSLLWAPHWAGLEKAPYDADNNGNGIIDADEITQKVRTFLEAGNSMFAECASIEVFEHSPYGHFLTDVGIGHNGGTMDATKMHYDGAASPFAQTGNLQFVPTGGHLHNWRPFVKAQDVSGPPAEPYNKKGGYTPVPTKNASYNATVTRFAYDDANGLNLATNKDRDQWDYYVGGYTDGDATKGYVVYLGGHSYGDKACATSVLGGGGGGGGIPGPAGTHMWSIQFDSPPLAGTMFDITVSGTDATGAPFTSYAGNLHFDGNDVAVGTTLQLDFSGATISGSTISNIAFNNISGGVITVTEIRVRRSDGITTPNVVRVWDQDILVDFYNGPGLPLEAVTPPAGGGCTSSYQIAAGGSDNVRLEWKKDLQKKQSTTFTVNYNGGKSLGITFDTSGQAKPSTVTSADGSFEIDFSGAAVVSGDRVEGVVLRNLGLTAINIESVDFAWTKGDSDQKMKKYKYNNGSDSLEIDARSVASGSFANNCGGASPTVQIAPPGAIQQTVTTSCGDNSACGWKNAAAVRYVLNTLFNLQFTVNNTEFSRSAPIVDKDNLLLAGSFDYPAWRGHLRAYDATAPGGAALWDAATAVPAADARTLFTNTGGVISDGLGLNGGPDQPAKTPFTFANAHLLAPYLAMTDPVDADDNPERQVINRVRGKDFIGADPANPAHYADMTNRLGAIEHSAAAIIGPTNAAIPGGDTRQRVAYIGTLDGILEAIDAGHQNTAALDAGSGAELWGFIPGELLKRLQNDRTDPLSPVDYAGVDASPTVTDVQIDYDGDGTPEPRTVLVGAEGYGGKSIFAMDVSDPATPQLLWEATDIRLPEVGWGSPYLIEVADTDADGDGIEESVQMGHAYKTAISRVFLNTNPPEATYVAYVATGYAVPGNWLGGVRVYAFRLDNGEKLWEFHANYLRSVNDIPGALTSVDANSDGFADWVFVGDNNGRLWQFNAATGENPYGPVTPLYNAGNDDPIATSPAVAVNGGEVVLFFGTGGADWAPADAAHLHKLIAVKAGFHHADAGQGVGEVLFEEILPAGEKVFSSPVLSGTVLYLGTVVGTVESDDPTQDLPAVGATVGSLRAYDVGNAVNGLAGAPTVAGTIAGAGNVRATLHIQNDALYGATIDGGVVQVGTAGNGAAASVPPVDRFFWRQVQ